MTHIEKIDNGTCIDHKFLFGYQESQEGMLCLASVLGEDMRYSKQTTHVIDYPGEYDIDGINILCFLGNGDLLSFLVQDQGDKFALIQTPDVLESHVEILSAQSWLYLNDTVVNKLEQLELDGEKIKLD